MKVIGKAELTGGVVLYLSDLYISNYRSIKNLHIPFGLGRNVLVGKNNAGKSNIIKAMGNVIGESRGQRLEINDFHATEVNDSGHNKLVNAKELFIAVKLRGLIENIELPPSTTIQEDGMLNWYKEVDGIRQLNDILKMDVSEVEFRRKRYKREELQQVLEDIEEVILYMHAERDEYISEKFHGVIVKFKGEEFYRRWLLGSRYSKNFITITILPSFREPESQLKLGESTWYNKLIRNMWENRDKTMNPEFENLNKRLISMSNHIFENATEDFRTKFPNLFPESSLNFRFISNDLDQLYKEVQLYIDDGFETTLHEKGSGMQSVVIINLFSYYCSMFHKGNSLLALEEPELYLHPQARRMVAAKLDEFITQGGIGQNQVIITTHSVEFLRDTNVENIIVIKSGEDKSTQAYYIQADEPRTKEFQKLRQLLWNKNSELFFADKVILVEGGEEYLIPAIADDMYGEKGFLDKNNISVIQVGGKSQFPSYIKILKDLGIRYYAIADFDYLERGLEQISNYVSDFDNNTLGEIRNGMKAYKSEFTKAKEIKNKILSPEKQKDAKALCQLLDEICTMQEYDSRLRELWLYLRPKVSKKVTYEDFQDNERLRNKVDEFMSILSKNNIMILRKGELEDYYTDVADKVIKDSDLKNRKELAVLKLLESVTNEQYTISDLLDVTEYGRAIQQVVDM